MQDDSNHLKIHIEDKLFRLNLENLDSECRAKVLSIFKEKNYKIEEVLVMFISNIREQSIAETQLREI